MKFVKLLGFLLLPVLTQAQTLTFDADTTTTNVQNGSGIWDLTLSNWWNGTANTTWDNSGSATAAFGTTGATGGTITLTANVNLAGIKFNNFGAAPSPSAYTINGGTINFASNAVIEAADNSSLGSTGNQFININSTLTGNNITIQRDSTGVQTSFQYVRFGAANPNLTGTLTLKAATASRSIFFLTSLATSVASFSQIVVENGSVFAGGGSGLIYNNAFALAGVGQNSGAIRIDGNGTNYAGPITLTADAAINTNTSIISGIVSGSISDGGANYGFQRLANSPDSILTLAGVSTYGGITTLGRSGAAAAGNTVLDFAAIAPAADLLYNGLATAGGLTTWGGTTGNTLLSLQGKTATANSQRFGAVSINGTRTNIVLSPGVGGSMSLSLGTITHASGASVNFVSPVAGAITTTTPDGFLGTWATHTNPAGAGSWVGVAGGVVTAFTGDLNHATNTALADQSGLAAMSNLAISGASTAVAALTLAGPTTLTVNTISMTDALMPRELLIEDGNTLRLGLVGGIQITAGSKDLLITGGRLTAGGTINTAGQLWLTNTAPGSTLTIDSMIGNNGSGALTVFINGTGNTIFNQANSFTGALQISSGSLEIRNEGALGTTAAATTILSGGTLRLAGDLAVAEPLSVSGLGVSGAGAIRNVSGNNILSGLTTLLGPTRINSDSGTLRFSSGDAALNSITGSQALTFGGAGTVIVDGRIASGTGIFTKDGTGTLILNGDNTFTGAITVNAGILRVGSANALGTVAGITTINALSALELYNNVALGAEPITLASEGINSAGGIRNISGNNKLTGAITLNATTTRINSDAGMLTLDVVSGNAIVHGSGSTRNLYVGGAGNIEVLDPMARTATTPGPFNLQKDGSGSVFLRSTVANTVTTLSNGVLVLDFPSMTTPTNILGSGVAALSTLSVSGGDLRIIGKSSTITSQAFSTLTVGNGHSHFDVVQNGATAVNLAFTTFARTQGGVLTLAPPTSGRVSTTGGTDNAIITVDNMAFITLGSNDWAATGTVSSGSRSIVGLSTISGGYTPSTATTLAGNADTTLGITATTLSADTTNTSLRLNAAQTTTITLNGTSILSTGGILMGTNSGPSLITGGTLRSASSAATNISDLVIIQNSTTSDLTISSIISNNVIGATSGLTKTGPGTLILEAATHTYAGTTRIQDGTLHVKSGVLSFSTEYTLGSGTSSGILKIGSGSTAVSIGGDWLRIEGTGAGNALVGGATVLSTFLLDNDITSDFRKGMIGSGLVTPSVENNVSLRLSGVTALLQLGATNTYAGKTSILRGIIEVETLANAGEASSIGTGSFNADSAVIEMASQTTGAVGSNAIAILRYVGSTDSVTNRRINLANSDQASDITEVVANLENNGTATVKFTSAFNVGGSNPVQRVLRLSGTNAGENEIVSIGDVSGDIVTKLEKTGIGLWALTGTSSYTAGTVISDGTLQLGNGGTDGMVGPGDISLTSSTAVLSTNRSNEIVISNLITGSGSLVINNTPTGTTILSNTANAYASTIVNSGTLLNTTSATTSALGTGPITVNPGAILGGYGYLNPAINNSVSLIAATLSPGDSTVGLEDAGILTISTSGTGALRFEASSILSMDLIYGVGSGNNTGNAGSSDLLVVSGNVFFGTDSTLKVNSTLSGYQDGDSWKLFDWAALGIRTGTFAHLDLPLLDQDYFWDTSGLYTTGLLTIHVVPEPSRLLLLALAVSAVILRRKRGMICPA